VVHIPEPEKPTKAERAQKQKEAAAAGGEKKKQEQPAAKAPAAKKVKEQAVIGLPSFPQGPLPLPMVHTYCFSNAEDWDEDVRQRVCAVLGLPADTTLPHFSVYDVRNVAPHKEMLCVSFQLPAVALQKAHAQAAAAGSPAEPLEKRQKT
jgi:hypothetical protein